MYLLLDKTKNQNEHSEKLSDQKIYFDNVSRFDYLVAILQEIAKKYLFTNTSNVAWNKDDSKNAHLDYIISKKLEDYVPFVEPST